MACSDARTKFLWRSSAPDAPGSRLLAQNPSLEEGELEIEIFGAASVRDELREVLRRVMAAGLPWDEVEIVTPDPETYGGTLHAISLQLGASVGGCRSTGPALDGLSPGTWGGWRGALRRTRCVRSSRPGT